MPKGTLDQHRNVSRLRQNANTIEHGKELSNLQNPTQPSVGDIQEMQTVIVDKLKMLLQGFEILLAETC